MNYTFQKRKELNDQFMKLFPDVCADYKRDGVPFIHVECLPKYVQQVEDVQELKEMLPDTPFPWRTVVAVAYRIKRLCEDGNFEELFEISYVNKTERSLEQAADRIQKGNLWAWPVLVELNHVKSE